MTDGIIRRQHRFTVLPEHLIRDGRVSDRAMRLWCVLDRYAGANGEAFPLRATLCADLGGISESSLDRAMAELCKAGWLSKARRYEGGPNDYTVLVVPAEEVPADALRGVSSHMTTPPPATAGDESLPSQETTPLVTGDDQKEASSKDQQGSENDSLRSSTTSKRGTRLPDDWQPTEEMRQWFREQPFANAVNPVMETQKFVDYWRAQPGQRGVKLDWVATWRNWMRTAAERLRPRTAAPQHPEVGAEHRERVAGSF